MLRILFLRFPVSILVLTAVIAVAAVVSSCTFCSWSLPTFSLSFSSSFSVVTSSSFHLVLVCWYVLTPSRCLNDRLVPSWLLLSSSDVNNGKLMFFFGTKCAMRALAKTKNSLIIYCDHHNFEEQIP